MGILAENLVWFLDHAKSRYEPRSILELGNQFLYICAKPFHWYPDQYLNHTMDMPIAAKPFFKQFGFQHTSIDLNGKDDALVLDLATPIDLGKQFSFATDFGTSEHVACLWQCLLNLHNHVVEEGRFFHVNPLAGNWPGHGNWYRDEEFYYAYAAMTGYKIIDMKRTAACGNTKDGWNIWCLLEKTKDSKFPAKDEFYTLPVKTI